MSVQRFHRLVTETVPLSVGLVKQVSPLGVWFSESLLQLSAISCLLERGSGGICHGSPLQSFWPPSLINPATWFEVRAHGLKCVCLCVFVCVCVLIPSHLCTPDKISWPYPGPTRFISLLHPVDTHTHTPHVVITPHLGREGG